MPFFILSLIVQVGLVVHVLKTGRNTTWVFILLFAPFVGALAYLIVELLPEMTHSAGARRARRSLSNLVNPNKDLQAASRNLVVADTAQNSLILANQHLARSQFSEAKELFLRSLRGVHSDDPVLLLGLAQSQFGLREFQDVIATLERLKEKNPEARSADGHLLFARAHEELGHAEVAVQEYEALLHYYAGPEPAVRLAVLLRARGDAERARQLFRKVVDESAVAGKHYNTLHKEWVSIARREAQS